MVDPFYLSRNRDLIFRARTQVKAKKPFSVSRMKIYFRAVDSLEIDLGSKSTIGAPRGFAIFRSRGAKSGAPRGFSRGKWPFPRPETLTCCGGAFMKSSSKEVRISFRISARFGARPVIFLVSCLTHEARGTKCAASGSKKSRATRFSIFSPFLPLRGKNDTCPARR